MKKAIKGTILTQYYMTITFWYTLYSSKLKQDRVFYEKNQPLACGKREIKSQQLAAESQYSVYINKYDH